ncbi:glucose dehydrogenase [Corynebacterium sphenisci]|uniref:glucose dehydrogenase n=1 Tax=Corynebacterium sphenisci TaxID=191493 RepID=UPI0026DEBB90|nr:glucose dehydrogenase [Corynebacterium sphenisci]MDO5731327.1 glucose dehydrogenase [Corynebacterium sphenisci]
MGTREAGRRRAAVAARCAALAAAAALAAGCAAAPDPHAGPFTVREAEPSPAPMPDAALHRPPTAEPRRGDGSDDPCARDRITLAACLPAVTALAPIGPARALAADATGDLWEVAPGRPPRLVAELGARVRQLLPSPEVAEDHQVHVLLLGGAVLRLTLLPGGDVDRRELDAPPGTIAIYRGALDPPGAPVNYLVAGDPAVEIVATCLTGRGVPPLLAARVDGRPQLVQLDGPELVPVAEVDFDDSIGGCAVAGGLAAVAVPGAQKVLTLPMSVGADPAPGAAQPPRWRADGAPETVLEGEFGHVATVAAVPARGGPQLWAGTANRELAAAGPAAADDRVLRLPDAGAAAGAAD